MELQMLPIKISDSRILVSAKIATPIHAIVADGKPAFVVFRRDLVNNAPQTVSVRGVARVARETSVQDLPDRKAEARRRHSQSFS
jgi:hypothetical protein